MESTKLLPVHVGSIADEKLIVKDNQLIMASYSLTVDEQRLLLACIEKAQRKQVPLNENSIEISLGAQEYAESYGVTMKTAYKALKNSSDRLYERSITMPTQDGDGIRKVRWLQESAVYESGKVSLKFSDVISHHLKYIVTEPTVYRFAQATQLRTQHAIRLFEILQIVTNAESGEGVWEISIDDFKETFQLTDSYDRWTDFRTKVIQPAIDQINKNTSLIATWEPSGKKGKSITHLRFTAFETNQLSLSLE